MKTSIEFKPIRRCLVKIGGRKGKLRHHQAYYSRWTQTIVLNWPWYQREKHVEANAEEIIEHESLHHVLEQRISSEACDKFDNFSYMGSVLEGLHPIRLEIVQQSKNAKMPKFKDEKG